MHLKTDTLSAVFNHSYETIEIDFLNLAPKYIISKGHDWDILIFANGYYLSIYAHNIGSH